MCIIAIKKKGIKFPSVEIVETMCENNPHGFSMVVSDGRKARVIRTMNRKKFMDRYKKIIKFYDPISTAMYIHTRIKTHGSNRVENCHGWRENGLIFAHNGILSIANRNDMTDSETFFRDIFSPAYKVGGWKLGEKTINAIIGTSKFVFMDDNGNIHHYGNYIEDDGILYSNTTYLPYKYPRVSKKSCGFNYGYSNWWDEYEDTKKEWNDALDCDKYPF